MSSHKVGNYNPHNAKGQFTSGRQYVDMEPNKEKQIEKNQKEAADKNIKSIVTGKATILSDKEFDRQSKGNKIYYRRNINPLEDTSVKGIGHKAHGDGLYFAEDKKVTEKYGTNKGELIRAYIKKDSKIIRELDAHKKFADDIGQKPRNASQVTRYIKDKGYDAMLVEKAYMRKSDYLLVFNRDKLVVNYIEKGK